MAQRKKMFEAVVHGIFLLLGLITVGCVLLITVYLIISGIPAIQKIGLVPFLTGKVWSSTSAEPKYGILPFILTSVYGTAGAIVLGVPIGFLTAVYLSKVAPKKVRTVLEAAVSLLAGIPSVVYGLVGMLVLVPAIRKTFHLPDGASLFAAIIVLAVMILPSIIKVSVTALEAVPHEYEDASLALGATEVETYFRVSVPTKSPASSANASTKTSASSCSARIGLRSTGKQFDTSCPSIAQNRDCEIHSVIWMRIWQFLTSGSRSATRISEA